MASAYDPSEFWPCYGRDPGGARYVGRPDVNKVNVAKLDVAWTFHTHDLSDRKDKPSSAFECTPIFVGDFLFVVSPYNRVFALDPDSGEAKWTYDPQIAKKRPDAVEPFACRGLGYWRDRSGQGKRVFLATYDAKLVALDAKTGKPVKDFGTSGSIDLREGLDPRYANHYVESSAPTVTGDHVIVGSSIGDSVAVHMPSGKVRSFDARTGKLEWTWEPLQNPADAGSGNAWTTISADPANDMVVLSTGSPSPDFFGGTRPGDDADADSVVALKASDGKKLWSFQVVHHDLWDYDVPSQPMLVDVSGKPAVVVTTKMGFVYVLDRLTGKPLLPVEERPVPASDVAEENASKTQPFPIMPKPLVPSHFEPWALSKQGRDLLKERLKGVRQDGVFTAPSVQGTLIYPGNLGGCNWSGGSYSPSSNTLFVNTNNLATLLYLVPKDKLAQERQKYPGHEITDEEGAPYGIRREWLLVPGNIPGSKPPWGVLHAIDLSTGNVRWQVPLGQMPQYADIPEAKEWGAPNLGGSFVTSTGLLFIAATVDPTIRAFDTGTGKVLWEHSLPAGGQAAPMLFRSPKTGKEYIVQCAGGHHGLGSPEGDAVVAFCLK
ncbi:MAG TPA: pyrroloquinoline quinone-dependent dehydrogenase [Fimbriimonas sp.]|nr:pyrroloquinoline quinone-dependent dehydrogenase [Fimbriimonas sp.]